MPNTLVRATRFHENGDLVRADMLYRKLLVRAPRHAHALHMRGVLRFQQGDYPLAEKLLLGSLKQRPDEPWVYYHLGEVRRAVGDYQDAEENYKSALALGLRDVDVYFMLGNVQFEQSLLDAAVVSYSEALRLAPEDGGVHLNLANTLESLERIDEAIEQLRMAIHYLTPVTALNLQLVRLLAKAGRCKEAVRELAELDDVGVIETKQLLATTGSLINCGQLDVAARLLENVVSREPASIDIRLEQAHLRALSGDVAGALRLYQALSSDDSISVEHGQEIARQLVALDAAVDAVAVLQRVHAEYPGNQGITQQLTGVLIDLGRYDEARELLDKMPEIQSASATSRFQAGLCAQASGQFEQAARMHRAALAVDRQMGSAAYSLVSIGNAHVTMTEVQRWQQDSERAELSNEQRANYQFAIGRALDQHGHYDQAFEIYSRGNALMKQQRQPFDPESWDHYIGQIISTYDKDYFSRTAGWGNGGHGLVFLVGMPRCGSTLLETQLTKQFIATGLGEHAAARKLFHGLPGLVGLPTAGPECATRLERQHVPSLQRQYIDSLPIDCECMVVDKMLGNFLRLGLIATLFPHARIINARRDKHALSVSCFINVFAHGLRFTYDLYWLGRAWSGYERLLRHWHDVLPLRILDVNYEEIVTQPSATYSQIAEFLDADWRPEPVGRAAVSNDINTASFWQARQPVYQSSLDAWERFKPYLEPFDKGLKEGADVTD